MIVKGGMYCAADQRVHTTFGHNPSSLRLCSFDPNLQNIPRGGKGIENYVKEIFVAPEGFTFWERDFSGIEARLVGWFAGSRKYVYITGIDVHSFYTAYALNALDGRVSANDLPDIEWEESRLRTRLKEIKKEFGTERNELYKHLVHGANYLQSPPGAQSHIFKTTGKAFDLKIIRKVMGVYFELFPEIPIWHRELCARVDGTKRSLDAERDPWSTGVCWVKNPFGYCHRFYDVLTWDKVDGKWYSNFGEDAKRCVSFLPQSTAAAIIKKAAKQLWYEYPWCADTLRLLIHDSILGECKETNLQMCLDTSQKVMEQPIEELPLDPSWNMGTYLTIFTEAKWGKSWGEMSG